MILPTGQCVHRFTASQGPVTALAIDSKGETIFTGGTNGAVRLWSLRERRTTLDIPGAHRSKDGDAVLDIACHPSLPVLATAGADAIVKLWSSS
jgi:WD40 repeat protein